MKNKFYTALEKNFVTYSNLLSIDVIDNKEPLVPLTKTSILFGYKPAMSDMKKFGKNILVRRKVAEMLEQAQNLLKRNNKGISLFVTYGYRNLSVQKKNFKEIFSKIALNDFYPNPIDLYEKVHQNIAVPTVAGHPTGGAVDIIIVNSNTKKVIDFGSEQYDFLSKKSFAFSPEISKKSINNRMLSRKIMMQVGFAPYDAEWWHFSYGDREWAFYCKKPYALYDQITKEKIQKL